MCLISTKNNRMGSENIEKQTSIVLLCNKLEGTSGMSYVNKDCGVTTLAIQRGWATRRWGRGDFRERWGWGDAQYVEGEGATLVERGDGRCVICRRRKGNFGREGRSDSPQVGSAPTE